MREQWQNCEHKVQFATIYILYKIIHTKEENCQLSYEIKKQRKYLISGSYHIIPYMET